MEREDFIKDWLEGKIPTKDLEKRLQEDEELAALKNVIQQSGSLQVPQKRSKAEAWELLEQKMSEKKSGRVLAFKPWVLGIAASVLLVVSYFTFLTPQTVRTGKGEHVSYTLPDGSEVRLNADSKITFKKFSREDQRRVILEGEVFFNVTKGGPFDVVGDNGTVSVLGTRFNVSQRKQTLEVACFTGSVKVTSISGQIVTLRSGELTRTDGVKLTDPIPVNEEKEASWRDGEFYFENISLADVLDEVERQFDVEIIYNAPRERIYTGYFNNKDLDEALQLVCTPMSLEYRKEGDNIYIE